MQHLALDLDHTILNTTRFKADLAKSLQLKPQEWDRVYAQYVTDNSMFDAEGFLQGVETQQQKDFYKVLQTTYSYLYPDAMDFIKRHLSAGWTITVVTYGNPEWQSQKVKHIDLPKDVTAICTDKPKSKALATVAADRLVLIDDRGDTIDEVKTALPHVETIWMKRNEGKYRDQPPQQYDKMIEDLTIDL